MKKTNYDRMNEVYEAALKVFAKYGFKKATVEEIAQTIGLTKGALYQYCEDKRDLYIKAVKYGMTKWQNKVLNEIIDIEDIRLQFRMLCKKAMMYLSDDKDLRDIIVNDPDIFPISFKNDPYKEINDISMMYLRNILGKGISKGVFRQLDIDLNTKLLFSIYKMIILETYVLGDQDSEKVFDGIIDMVSQGFFISNDEKNI